jgi:hypothetical protein
MTTPRRIKTFVNVKSSTNSTVKRRCYIYGTMKDRIEAGLRTALVYFEMSHGGMSCRYCDLEEIEVVK